MEEQTSESVYRDQHTPEWRSGNVRHSIDPGFVHVRKIETIIGPGGMSIIDGQIRRLPPDLPDWQKSVRLDHIYARAMLLWCQANNVAGLRQIRAKRRGSIFCSNEEIGPARVIGEGRVSNQILLEDDCDARFEVHYSTLHIHGDTQRERLRDGGYTMSIIAELRQINGNVVVFDPIVMGSPWLEADESGPYQSIEWYSSEFYEQFVEDFDEFARIKVAPQPPSPEPMRHMSEAAVKRCFSRLLGDAAAKDWGGEMSDFFTAHLHLGGRRMTAAFLLKGPARFEPMTLRHLGKNSDQIVRLADEPAEALIVQHCHDITPVVRKTIRAFAVQPSRPRRYCCIDGRDTLRLLQAYDLYKDALAFTEG